MIKSTYSLNILVVKQKCIIVNKLYKFNSEKVIYINILDQQHKVL